MCRRDIFRSTLPHFVSIHTITFSLAERKYICSFFNALETWKFYTSTITYNTNMYLTIATVRQIDDAHTLGNRNLTYVLYLTAQFWCICRRIVINVYDCRQVVKGAMIGAMPAVAVRHERRKKKNEKSHRPNQLMLKPHMNKSDGTLSPLGSHAGSRNPSRAGSPTHGQHADGDPNETILGEYYWVKLVLDALKCLFISFCTKCSSLCACLVLNMLNKKVPGN